MAKPRKRKPVRVLSLAAGAGHDLKNIRNFYPTGQIEYHHADLDPKKVQMCRSPDKKVNIIPHVGRTDDLIKDSKHAPSEFFDQVHLNMQTTGPYLLDSEERLRHLGRILKPGGRLFVTEQAPAVKEPLEKIRKRSGGKNVFLMAKAEHPYGLRQRPRSDLRKVRRFNSRLARRLRNSGFSIDKAQLIPGWKLGMRESPEGYEVPPGIDAEQNEKNRVESPKKLLEALTGYSRLANQLLVLRKKDKS
jgi:SAM-dependent methyltransferase